MREPRCDIGGWGIGSDQLLIFLLLSFVGRRDIELLESFIISGKSLFILRVRPGQSLLIFVWNICIGLLLFDPSFTERLPDPVTGLRLLFAAGFLNRLFIITIFGCRRLRFSFIGFIYSFRNYFSLSLLPHCVLIVSDRHIQSVRILFAHNGRHSHSQHNAYGRKHDHKTPKPLTHDRISSKKSRTPRRYCRDEE